MAVTMRAQVLEKFNQPYTLRDVPMPRISHPYDIIVRVQAASYCHTDELLRIGAKSTLPDLPFIGCHEVAGEVVEVGKEVHNLRVNDMVGILTKGYHSCGLCSECQASQEHEDEPGYSVYCAQAEEIGLTISGGFAEFVVVDSRQTTRIPDNMTAVETAPLMCAGVSMYAALLRCQLPPGASVGIIGSGGGLGHLGLQFAVKMGFRAVGVEAADKPLSLARQVAPDAMHIDARTNPWPKAKDEINARHGSRLNGRDEGLDAVIILTESQKSFDYAINLLRRGGKCMLVAFPRHGILLNPLDPIARNIQILGSSVGSSKMLRDMMQFVSSHGIRSRSKLFPFSQLNRLVVDSHESQGGKYVLDMSMED